MNNKRAIALHYDGQGAPNVAAKGYNHLAEHIIEQVKKQGGLIHQDEALSEYLNNLEVGDEIPENLYRIIAELIAFSWLLNGKTPPGWEGLTGIDEQV
ncbi:EscU/YscU/HrcU family type III secretion system export apparatus switch protein [Photobacterium sp. SDRW27]|uniref:EscU/YscU/HrcU family type III secretion system export apparatus switch protein n=1 Tax=Photobacterium obscurum TaxID=2829490 RepID=UPI002244672B|nr:EscU/YscU/HrcU family type III secretion system export apparatus switch protein [Photobacterium obscurum]MCW8328205.1 EscU/YscU/HrcU family type III secretion system export apparatus switch protein [Photobacterium obscurum]